MDLTKNTRLYSIATLCLGCLLLNSVPAEAQPIATELLDCPIAQKSVKNGAKPDAELFKKIVRCKKGDEGAVRVDVTALQIGTSRPWSYRQDSGRLTMKIADGLVCFKQKNQYSCNFGIGLSDGKTQLGFTC